MKHYPPPKRNFILLISRPILPKIYTQILLLLYYFINENCGNLLSLLLYKHQHNTSWSANPKIFTTWLFMENVCQLSLEPIASQIWVEYGTPFKGDTFFQIPSVELNISLHCYYNCNNKNLVKKKPKKLLTHVALKQPQIKNYLWIKHK